VDTVDGMDQNPDERVDSRTDVREFLVTRRARLRPEQVGLPPGGGRRRVPGLRREEVAVLAGVSPEWYARLEKGHISEMSDDVLDAVARALQLDDEERTYLFDLARAARPAGRKPRRRKTPEAPASIQWMLDSMTMSAAFVSDARMDVLAANSLGRAMYSPMFDRDTTGRPNLARFHFLDPAAPDFYVNHDAALTTTVALLRAEAGRHPDDRILRELIGELSTLSPQFRTLWAAHDVRLNHRGTKQFHHPEVGDLELAYQSLDLPISDASRLVLTIYTPEPATTSEDRFRLLASWAATPTEQAQTDRPG
jgi:transcriptional regulator with XRE-family HTH domain